MKRYIQSAGYHGYSMSNNAVDAYENGEMPLSKWNKSAILNELANQEVSQEIIDLAKTLSLNVLKEIFLYKSSWHHTSKMYNRTNFYSVNPEVTLSDINSYLKQHQETNSIKPQYRYCKVYYGGPCYAIYKPYKFYVYKNGVVITVSGFDRSCEIIEYYDEIPSGTEKIFSIIENSL